MTWVREALCHAWTHVRSLWPRCTLLPALALVPWPVYCLLRGEHRWELVLVALLGLVLPYFSTASKRLFIGILPVGLVGILYDASRYFESLGLTPTRIHLCDLRELDLRLLPVPSGASFITIQDYVALHPNLTLDLFFAVPYGTFIGAIVLFAGFLYFRDFDAMLRFTLAFLGLNLAGFATYHLFPAAAPWYYHAHGCTITLDAAPSEGANLARVDAFLGFSYFGGFYERSHDVFGAMPSLHVAYPLLISLEAWNNRALFRRDVARWSARVGSILFFLWMCGAAVYLDHHWLSDELAGIIYGLVAFFAIAWAKRRFRLRDAAHAESERAGPARGRASA